MTYFKPKYASQEESREEIYCMSVTGGASGLKGIYIVWEKTGTTVYKGKDPIKS